MAPALSLFCTYGLVLVSAMFFDYLFQVVTAVLTFICLLWIANLACLSIVGAYQMRSYTDVDWHAKLEALQNDDHTANEVLHIVLLPNFQENERMLLDTLENLGRSPLARSRTRIVLAMEQREGQGARDKAERLIQKTSYLFADIFATFHPSNLPGEVPGKSSNTQWAYRAALRQYGPVLLGCDHSRVFITVGDADTLWHPQYFSAVTYEALTQSTESRVWKIWQPPILLVRNLWNVPAVTRASSHATIIFDLSELASQVIFPCFAYSAYTLSLALASHPEVDGWDVDVIAEDHHMFCKCYFAGLWEKAHAISEARKRGEAIKDTIRTQVEIQPVMLPAVSYLVESTNGYMASVYARFQQARRHSQGVVELGYVLLQYCRLWKHAGLFALPFWTHWRILAICTKMQTLHITATAQCFALILATATDIIPKVLGWVQGGGVNVLLAGGIPAVRDLLSTAVAGWSTLNGAQQAFYTTLSNISGVVVFYSFTNWVVLKDLQEGSYYKHMGNSSAPMRPVMEEPAQQNERSEDEEPERVLAQSTLNADGKPNFVTGKMTGMQSFLLFLCVLNDTATIGYVAITLLGMIPVCLAAYSLMKRGTQFEYIVAEKPE